MNRKLVGKMALCLILATGTLVAGESHARADIAPTIDVPATADIFATDLASVPAFDGGGGTLPPSVAVAPGTAITASASGSVDCGGGAPSGPDGSTGGGTVSIQSYGGISGADIPGGPVCGLALVGVFTGTTPPSDPAPARLNFVSGVGTSFTSLTPVLNQTFFIGDGVTGVGTGTTQTFVVPQGATTLWLGFQDGQNYTSAPGYYGDNTGSVSVSVTPVSVTPVITTSPDYKIVRYIHSFSIPNCVGSFVANGVSGGLTACAAIDATSNPVPKADIADSGANWTKFQNSKEYRSIVHLPSYEIACDTAGNLVSPPMALGSPGISAGFTPIRLLIHTFYVAGDKYQGQNGIWYDVNPEVDIVTPSTVRITYRIAARAGTAENGGNPAVSGYSLPFVWTLIQEQLSCGKDPATMVTYSQMPSIMIYKDGTRVMSDIQTSDLGGFVKAGGIGRPIPGQGNLYIPCRAFGLDQLAGVPITPDCKAAASPSPSWAVFTAP